MSRDGLVTLSGLARRRRERQPLHQVEDLAGQPGREPGDTGDDLGGRGQDDFRPALRTAPMIWRAARAGLRRE